jgi:hypothetical protein
MKTRYFIIPLLSWLMSYSLSAQDVNFRRLDNTRNVLAASFGADYNSYYGVSYGYVLNTRFVPMVVGTEVMLPFGNTILDDWKWKGGIQADLFKSGNFSLVLKLSGVIRRYESSLSRAYNFGSDMTVNAGYVRRSWGIVGVAGVDKAIATHIRHNQLKEYYPEIQDGWYVPTGGNFKFGARVHVSMGTWNSFLTVGKHYGQNFKDNPTYPFFAEVSVQKRF